MPDDVKEQVIPGAEDMILPEDFKPETTPEAGTEVKSDTPASEEKAPETVADKVTVETDYSPFLKALSEKAKFNHQPVEIKSIDDVVANYQKGMNYDKLQEKLNAIQNDPRLGKFDKVVEAGKLLGYQTEDELIEMLFNTYYESQAQTQGLTPEQIKKDYELTQRENAQTAKEKHAQQTQQRDETYNRFFQAYPNVQVKDIKPETWAKVRAGVDLVAAFAEQRNQELEAKLRIQEQNKKNESRAPVGGTTNHGAGEPGVKDPFIEGFDSVV
jgi:hypothetical protein